MKGKILWEKKKLRLHRGTNSKVKITNSVDQRLIRWARVESFFVKGAWARYFFINKIYIQFFFFMYFDTLKNFKSKLKNIYKKASFKKKFKKKNHVFLC
jgi:hypothetical protein